jgi:DNA processing protein
MLGVGCDGPLGPVHLLPAMPDGAAGEVAAGSGAGRSARPTGIREREAWAVLASVDGIGPASFASLVRRFGSAAALLARATAGVEALRDLPGDPDPAAARRLRLDEPVLARIVAAACCPETVLEDVETLGLTIVTLEDEVYPPALRATELAPPVLFVLGDLRSIRHAPAIAVVGTRRPTERGRRTAARIAGAIARAGAAVVSGLAIGIDGVAHEAALAEGARTVAVLGAGHRHITPSAHRALARRIVDAGGAIVSEYPPHALPTTWSFPRRNRVISGTTSATIVVEAAVKSGALITAAWALEQGRECFLVPGSLDDEAARGSLRFLRDHSGLARVVAGVPELLEDLGLADTNETPVAAAVGPVLGDAGRRVAALVAAGHGTVDEIAALTDLPAATVLGVLTVLELQGLVVGAVGRYRPAGLLATRGAGAAGTPSRPNRPGRRSRASSDPEDRPGGAR